MSLVIDCSTTMAWCFEDEASAKTDELLEVVATDGAIVPDVWLLEVANVLLVAERRHRLKRADAERFVALLAQLPIAIHQNADWVSARRVMSLARDLDLSSYDASYLDLAMQNGAALATTDKALQKAATAMGVALRM